MCRYENTTAGFNDVCVCSLLSTTCLSGGYPVTLTCWHYTKHWSLSTCNYYSNMDSCNVTMDMVSQAAHLLLYNYLRTNNTLQLFLWFFFSSCFLNVWIYKLWTVLRGKGEVKGGKEKDSGVKRSLNYPAQSLRCERTAVKTLSTVLAAVADWKPAKAKDLPWAGRMFLWATSWCLVCSGAPRLVSGLLWVSWDELSSNN